MYFRLSARAKTQPNGKSRGKMAAVDGSLMR
jgi:hypothetical protein